MARSLKEKGVVEWFAKTVQEWVSGFDGLVVVLVLAVIYFYSMYGFSMLTGHIAALIGAFFAVALASGTPSLAPVQADFSASRANVLASFFVLCRDSLETGFERTEQGSAVVCVFKDLTRPFGAETFFRALSLTLQIRINSPNLQHRFFKGTYLCP